MTNEKTRPGYYKGGAEYFPRQRRQPESLSFLDQRFYESLDAKNEATLRLQDDLDRLIDDRYDVSEKVLEDSDEQSKKDLKGRIDRLNRRYFSEELRTKGPETVVYRVNRASTLSNPR